jgi:hypothetical protein
VAVNPWQVEAEVQVLIQQVLRLQLVELGGRLIVLHIGGLHRVLQVMQNLLGVLDVLLIHSLQAEHVVHVVLE